MMEQNPKPDNDVRMARSGSGIADATWRSRFDLVGPDRAPFLEGQCTQHIARNTTGQGGYGFVLEPKGAVVTDLDFLILDDRIAIEAPVERREALQAWLGKFLLLSDAELIDRSDDTAGLMLVGPDADARLGAARLPEAEGNGVLLTIAGAPVIARRDLSCGIPGWSLRVSSDARDDVLSALDVTVISAESVDIMRTEAGRPRFNRELNASVLPKETGQESRAVSYDKGCYCGQEVVARQHFIGNPRKALVGLVPRQSGTRADDPVTLDDKELGVLGTVHRSPTLGHDIALCILKGAEHEAGAVRVIQSSNAGPVIADVVTLPFVT